MAAEDTVDDKKQPSLVIKQICWQWREQWPFKDSKSHPTNSQLNARYNLPEVTPRPPDVCFRAAGADFAAAAAFCF